VFISSNKIWKKYSILWAFFELKAMHQYKKLIKVTILQFLNNLSEEEFLKTYWEKKPFIIRGAVSDAEMLVDTKDLMAMAKDEDYETRMISKENNSWDVNTGPFEESVFSDKEKFWTLIVHNMNLYFDRIKNLENQVEFIPKWLFDDVMCTYSTKGSSVGAHIDTYNVFILQTAGQRKWSVQEDPNPEYQEDVAVKLLKKFKADEEYILNPGDMIYIPPHVAHWGESLTESCSLSIGFKSLEDKEMLDLFCLGIIHQENVTNDFYRTNFTKSQRDNSFEIEQSTIDDLYNDLLKNINQKQLFEEFITKELSTPKNVFEANEDLNFAEFESTFEEINLYKDEYTRGVFRKNSDQFIYGINSLNFTCNLQQAQEIESLLRMNHKLPISKSNSKNIMSILFELYTQGSLYFSED
jgi:50S ribosomal protein L16 3-hydroxylase